MRQVGERADIGAAVPAMALVEFFRFEMAAVDGIDFFTAQPFLDVHVCGARQFRLWRRWRKLG